MPTVVLGYGNYKGYRLSEAPLEQLEEAALRHPLALTGPAQPAYDYLLATVAIHGELRRRASGGQVEPTAPTVRELAQEIVRQGFRHASKQPDPAGTNEYQRRLEVARNELTQACQGIDDDAVDRNLIILLENGKCSRGLSRKAKKKLRSVECHEPFGDEDDSALPHGDIDEDVPF